MLKRAALLFLLTAAAGAAGNVAKTRSTEKRVNQLVGTIGQLNFEALAQFQSKANTEFLAGLSQLPHQTTSNAGGAGTDSNSGPYWATGERGFINTNSGSIDGLANALNGLQSNLQSFGYQA
jgi:hypothetical protein